MFDRKAFTKAGAVVERRAAAAFYAGFGALARDSNLREACGDDHLVALGALSLTADLLTGAMTLSPEHIQSGAFRDLARQRGLDEIAERTELQGSEATRKSAPKRKACEVILATEPDRELVSYMQNEGLERIGSPGELPVAFEGLACMKSLKAHLRREDRIIVKTMIAGTRDNGGSPKVQPESGIERGTSILPLGVEPYVTAYISTPGMTFQDASADELSGVIIDIVRIESPINRPILQRRLRTSFVLDSIRSIHEERIDAAIQAAIDQGHLRRTEDGFLLATTAKYVVPRFRTSEDEDVRATSTVSSIEIRAAVALQMQNDPTVDQAAIVIGAAAILGFALKTEQTNRPLSDKIRAEVQAAFLP